MDEALNIRDMRKQLGDTQSEFAERYNIPFRTVQNWETGMRKPPESQPEEQPPQEEPEDREEPPDRKTTTRIRMTTRKT